MSSKAQIAVTMREDGSRPWMGIPGVTADGKDVDAMFHAAGLDGWNVRKREILTDARTSSPDFEVVRDNPDDGLTDRLHIAKARYEEYQNESARDFAKNIAHGNLTADAMGALNGGRQVFMSFTLGDAITIAGTDDKVQSYLNVFTSHDGSWALGTYLNNMRMDCQNMIRSLRSHALASFKARHTKSLEGRVEDARRALGVSLKSQDVFSQDMAALATADVTESKFWSLVKDIYPEPEKDVRGSLAKWTTKTDTIMGLWNGPTLAGLDNTAYKAYNALNEYSMWYATVRSGNVENALVRASGFDEKTQKDDVALYRKVLALA